ncbi:MAG: putative multidrug resistance protein [Ignavibacteriales bacterium]
MHWIILFIAGLFEIAWAIGMKYSDSFSKPWASTFTIVCMIISFALLSYAMKFLPVGTAYGIWTGIGAVGTAIMGIILFNDPKDLPRLLFLGMICVGIIGLKMVSSHQEP